MAAPVPMASPIPAPAPAPAPAPQPRHAARRKPSGWGKLWASLGLATLAYGLFMLAQIAAGFFMMGAGVELNPLITACEVLAAGLVLLFIAGMGGARAAKPSKQNMGDAWKAATWLLIVDGALVLIEIVGLAMGEETIEIAPDWPWRMVMVVVLCLAVGLFEEGLTRGLCLNGLLARMGRTTGGVLGAAIISSLLFGFMHFDLTIDFGDPLLVAQNFMKVLQTGMVGYLLAGILVSTRNLWAVALIHGATDFMLMFITYGLTAEEVSTEYVATGPDGMEALMVYAVMCVLYLPMVVTATRRILKAGPWRGLFWNDGGEGDGQGV